MADMGGWWRGGWYLLCLEFNIIEQPVRKAFPPGLPIFTSSTFALLYSQLITLKKKDHRKSQKIIMWLVQNSYRTIDGVSSTISLLDPTVIWCCYSDILKPKQIEFWDVCFLQVRKVRLRLGKSRDTGTNCLSLLPVYPVLYLGLAK